MRKFLIIFGAAISAALLLGSCAANDPEILTVYWQADGDGYLQFRTNDANDYNKPFIYIPSEANNSLIGGADWTAQADVIQLAGTTLGGFGLVVGYDGLDTPSLDCMIFLVNCSGQYKIMQRASGIISEVSSLTPGWVSSGYIKSYNQINTLKAVYDQSESKLSFFANDHELCTLNGYALGQNTQAGFFNGILSKEYEGFPRYYSDRRFKLTSPLVYPTP
jgi:hypothetical protein